jgi:hypothetical protein
VCPHQREGGVDGDLGAFGEHTPGLLDEDSVVQRRLQLLGPYCRKERSCSSPMVATSAIACPTAMSGSLREAPALPEQVDGADHLLAQPHRQRMG